MAVTQAMLALLLKAPSASIVNVSSGLGSLTKSGDPSWTHVAATLPRKFTRKPARLHQDYPKAAVPQPDDAGIAEENVGMAEIGIDSLRRTSNRGGIPELDLQLDGRPRRLHF
jgi:hypothetical protein